MQCLGRRRGHGWAVKWRASQIVWVEMLLTAPPPTVTLQPWSTTAREAFIPTWTHKQICETLDGRTTATASHRCCGTPGEEERDELEEAGHPQHRQPRLEPTWHENLPRSEYAVMVREEATYNSQSTVLPTVAASPH